MKHESGAEAKQSTAEWQLADLAERYDDEQVKTLVAMFTDAYPEESFEEVVDRINRAYWADIPPSTEWIGTYLDNVLTFKTL